jgi:hypothetical protein
LGTPTFSQDEKVKEFQIYPNPTSGIIDINIYFDMNDNFYSNIEIYNSSGELVMLRPVQINGGGYGIHDSFNLAEYPSGIYFIRIDVHAYTLISKVILLR